MSKPLLPILQDPAVLERTSPATRRALEARGMRQPSSERYLPDDLYGLLQEITSTMLPQARVGTDVDIAASIDHRLLTGTNMGWRFADLPPDGEAYRHSLTALARMLQQTSSKSFHRMPPAAREDYLRCVADGDMDGPAQFPLSKWLGMLRTDAVQIWMAHPSTMQKMEYYGFADGETGQTNGPTAIEGWAAITPNTPVLFEQGTDVPAQEQMA